MSSRTRKDRVLNERVRAHVELAAVTEEQIAKRTGWHPKKVYRILHGHTKLLAEHMPVFARILHRSIDELFRDPVTRKSA